jgi:hypothetical protein
VPTNFNFVSQNIDNLGGAMGGRSSVADNDAKEFLQVVNLMKFLDCLPQGRPDFTRRYAARQAKAIDVINVEETCHPEDYYPSDCPALGRRLMSGSAGSKIAFGAWRETGACFSKASRRIRPIASGREGFGSGCFAIQASPASAGAGEGGVQLGIEPQADVRAVPS